MTQITPSRQHPQAPRTTLRLLFALFTLLPASFLNAFAAPVDWLPFGPDGGDARRMATDPSDHHHLYLGTATGWIYESHNNGTNWRRVSRVGKRDDLVLDSIVVDPTNPKHLVIGAWVVGSADGGLFTSADGGATWTNQPDLLGQSVRSLAQSASSPRVFIAGTLSGIFRSTDGATHWTRISPEDSTEIHEVESVAIDPKDPQVVYAGTWHLPWKTTDGGATWSNIKDGIIDDSDVFSIIVDPVNPATVYASACSGIYKSENAGTLFHKVQGIPSSARRTRILLQDPKNLATVFAGTTEGLFRSDDAGRTWTRTTGPEIIVNDVSINADDSRIVLIATDRGGVLASDDGGDTFHSSNNGFSARQITAMRRDAGHPATLYVGVVNDKEWGGTFESPNGGLNWVQRSQGLGGRDVFSLGQAADGTLIAGTAHGLFRLDGDSKVWNEVENVRTGPEVAAPAKAAVTEVAARPPVPVGRNQFTAHKAGAPASPRTLRGHAASTASRGRKSAPAASRKTSAARAGRTILPTRKSKASARRVVAAPVRHVPAPPAIPARGEDAAPPVAPHRFSGSVYAIVNAGPVLLATTSEGLLTSADSGLSWTPAGPEGSADWRFLAAAHDNVAAASLHQAFFSSDAGRSWTPIRMPDHLTQLSAIAVVPSGEIWLGGGEGVFVSSDAGNTWARPKDLYVRQATSLFYDEATSRMILTAGDYEGVVFTVQFPEKKVAYVNTGWNLRLVRPIGDHFVAATLYDGVVVQPRMVASPIPEPPGEKPAPAQTPPAQP